MVLVAHIRESDHKIQTVEEHLDNVARLSRELGDRIGFGAHAELAGFLHDMGKMTHHFTDYLEKAVIFGEIPKERIDHSTAGAKYLYEQFYKNANELQKLVIEIVGMAILSHHSGIQNFNQIDQSESDFIRRVVQKKLPYYDEVETNFINKKSNIQRVSSLLTEATTEFMEFSQKIKDLKRPFTYVHYVQELILSILLD